MLRRALKYVALYVLVLSGCTVSNQRSSARQGPPSLSEPTTSADPQVKSGATLIKPGRSVGMLRLGGTREEVLKLLGEKHEEYNYDYPCKYTEMHWYDVARDRNGVFIYLKDGFVFQIGAATPYYHTADGISEESSPEDVRRNYKQLRSYALLRSGADIVGGRDLIYWVDGPRGVAFEFYYNRKAGKRRVSKVIVFEPGSEFKPEGCVSPPQEFVELEPFALEPVPRTKVMIKEYRRTLLRIDLLPEVCSQNEL